MLLFLIFLLSGICGISVLSSAFPVRPAKSLGPFNIETICHNLGNEMISISGWIGMWYLTSENILFFHILFLKRKLSLHQ